MEPGQDSGAVDDATQQAEMQELAAQSAAQLEVEARLRAAIRILVIDNEVEAADRVVMLLERAGYESEIATDGASGLSLCERFRPHLVVLGAITNSVNPTEFARQLRAAAQEPAAEGMPFNSLAGSGASLPILYLIDRAHLLQQRLQTLGATPLVEAVFKPVDERELLDKVARALVKS